MTGTPTPDKASVAATVPDRVREATLDRAAQDALALAALCDAAGGADAAWLGHGTPAELVGAAAELGLVQVDEDGLLTATPVGLAVAAEIPADELAEIGERMLGMAAARIVDPARASRVRASIAAGLGDIAGSADSWLAAARAAISCDDLVSASTDFARAVAATADPAAQRDVLHECARALHTGGGVLGIEAWRALEQATEGVDTALAREQHAEALFRRFWLDPGPNAELLARAADMHDGSTAWAARAASVVAASEADYAGSEAADLVALSLARARGDRNLEALTLTGIALSRGYLGRLAEAIDAQRAAIAIAPGGSTSRTRVEGTLNLADMLLEQLDLHAAAREVEGLASALEVVDAPGLQIAARINLAWLLGQRGQLVRALHIVQATPDASGAQAPWLRAQMLALAAHVLADAGRVERAMTLLDSAAALLDETPVVTARFEVDLARAETLAASGDGAAAIALLRTLQIDEPLSMAAVAMTLGYEAAIARDEDALAHAAQISAEAADGAPGSPYCDLIARQLATMVEAAGGDVAAGERMEHLAAEWRTGGFELQATRTLHAGAELLDRAGATRRAMRLRAEAGRAMSQAGATAAHARLAAGTRNANQLIGRATWTFLADAPPAVRDIIAGEIDRARVVRFMRGELVIRAEDESSTDVFLLRSGQVRLFRERPDGKQLLVGVITPGGFFGPGISPGAYPTLNAIASEDCELHVMSGMRLLELTHRSPEVTAALLAAVADDLARSQELAELVAFVPVEARLATLLVDLDRRYGHPTLSGGRIVNERFTQGELAAMIGASREQVARALGRWRTSELLRLDGKRIVILDLAAIRDLAAAAN